MSFSNYFLKLKRNIKMSATCIFLQNVKSKFLSQYKKSASQLHIKHFHIITHGCTLQADKTINTQMSGLPY